MTGEPFLACSPERQRPLTRDEPRVSSLIVSAKLQAGPASCAPHSTLRTCWVHYFEQKWVRFDERRGLGRNTSVFYVVT